MNALFQSSVGTNSDVVLTVVSVFGCGPHRNNDTAENIVTALLKSNKTYGIVPCPFIFDVRRTNTFKSPSTITHSLENQSCYCLNLFR